MLAGEQPTCARPVKNKVSVYSPEKWQLTSEGCFVAKCHRDLSVLLWSRQCDLPKNKATASCYSPATRKGLSVGANERLA